MKIYGYSASGRFIKNMKEATFSCDINDIDKLLSFLLFVKEKHTKACQANKKTDTYIHSHFRDWDKDWENGSSDFIVVTNFADCPVDPLTIRNERLWLNTPIGAISLYIGDDEIPIPFSAEKLDNTFLGQSGVPVFSVDGRYRISVDIADLNAPLSVSCVFGADAKFGGVGINDGEGLALKQWENGNLMLGIGTEDGIDGLDIEYLERGIKVNAAKTGAVNEVVFGIAWLHIKDCEKEQNYTWFAADPTYGSL